MEKVFDGEQVVTSEDMKVAEEKAKAIGCTPPKFRQAFILYTGKATPDGKIDFKRMTRKEYDDVVSCFNNAEDLQNLLSGKGLPGAAAELDIF